MNVLRIVAVLAWGATGSAVAGAATLPTGRQVAEIFAQLDRLDRPGCSIGVMREGVLIHSAAFGASDLQSRAPLEARTAYNIGSISKQFTAFAVLLLERDGKLSIDDPIRKYIGELGDYANGVTLRHLLHHIGGLRDYVGLLLLDGRSFTERATREQALDVLGRQRSANSPPGTQYEYSNTGYFLLGVVVERVSGRSLAQFSRDNIFRPLGMHHTSIVDHYPADIARLARGYTPGATGYELDGTLWEQTGDGQVHTNVEDLARWESNFINPTVGDRALISRMLEPARLTTGRTLNYAAGLALGSYRGLQTVRHGGDWAGYRAHYLRFPQQHFATAVLCNHLDAQAARYAAALADLYLGDALGQPEVSSHVRDLQAIGQGTHPERLPTGLYRNAATASYLRLGGNGATAYVERGGERSALEKVQADVFRIVDFDEFAVFQTAGHGRSARIITQGSPQSYAFELAASWQPQRLADYAGLYESDEVHRRFELRVIDGALVLATGSTTLALAPMTSHEFVGSGLPTEEDAFTLQFSAAADELAYFSEGLRGLRFKRLPGGAGASTRDRVR